MRKYRLLTMLLIIALVVPFSPVTAQSGNRAPTTAVSSQPASQLGTTPTLEAELTPEGHGEAFEAAIDPALERATGPVQIVIQLQDEPTAVTYAQLADENATRATEVAVAQLARIETAQQRLLQPLAEMDAIVLYRTQRVYNGIAVLVEAEKLPIIAKLPGVQAIYPLITKELDNWYSVPMMGSAELWDAAGAFGGLTGEGIKVAVIDTGIDYIHAGFGGPGVPAAYAANDTTVITDTYLGTPLFPTVKVVGGIDLVGDSYNANPSNPATYQPIPHPDPDPMDCNGHGSHVAGTVAGYGVNADGSTYAGPYDVAAAANFNTLAIGPGVAPGVELYAVRVFGCAGSTNVTDLAIEWATDPNGDGDFSDRVDVINMSLGSAYGSIYDSSAVAADNAAMLGVIVVASAGNNGDVYYITGSPGASGRTISVAAADDGGAVLGAFEVIAATGMATGLYPAVEAAFGPDIAVVGPIQNELVLADPPIACAALTNAAAINGKIALIDRGTCSFQTKVYWAQQAGAIAVLVANNAAGDPIAMGADATIPPVSIPSQMTDLTTGNALKTALTQGVVTVRLSADYRDSIRSVTPALKDIVASFSSRGPRRVDSMLKPDLTAPGVSIFSVANGTGTRGRSLQGTSMAAPHVAGAMALLREQHPSWTVEELKALAMNTSLNDVKSGANNVGPGRVGAGRITLDEAASSPVVAYNAGAPGLVSVSFGALEIASPTTLKRMIRVVNKSGDTLTYDVSYVARVDMPGVAYSLNPGTITLPPYGVKTIEVTITANPADMRRTGRDATVSAAGPRHWLSEEAGYATLTPTDPLLPALRVPLYATARPVSAMGTQQTSLSFAGATGTAVITATGTGLDTGSAYGTTDYLSLVTAFELQEISPDDPDENPGVNNADLKYIGAGSNYGGTGIASTLYFAIATHGRHSTAAASDAEFDIYIDIDEDGNFDYVVYNTTTGGSTPNDVFATVVLNLNTGVATLSNYVNIFTAAQYDTKIFNSDVIVLPVTTSLLGLSAANPRFDYQVVSFSRETAEGQTDISGLLSYTVGKPGLRFGTTGAPGFADLPGSTIPVSFSLPAYKANGSLGALLLHHHNANGATAQVLPVMTNDDLVSFSILHTNDFHGNLEPAGSNPGIARMATVINEVRAAVDPAYVRLFDAGDAMQGSLLSNLSDGAATIDLFNFVGYQAATFGNHEFDWGQTVLEERMDQAEYPYLATNLVVNNTGNCATAGWTHPDYVQPWTTMTVGTPGNEVVVGLIGVTSQETPYITVASATEGLCFKDATESISHYYDDVVAAGAEVLVIISHLGNVDGGYGYGIPVYGDQTLARNLINASKPVDLIIGGHSHTNLSAPQIIEVAGKPGKTYVVQAYYAGRRVGRADITYNRAADTVAISWQSLTVSTTGAQDPDTVARLNLWAQDPEYLALINTVIGFTNVDLIRRSTMDNTMGAFVNDAIYYELNNDAEPLNDVDMVFNNSGGLRADIIATGAPTTPFTLTYGMLFSVLPFGNQTVVGDMTGAQILELLNQSATLFKGTLQIAGIRFKYYSYGAPATFDAYHNTWWAWGAYDVEVKNGATWEPLEMDRVYRVGTNEFLAPAGQDGFAPFKYMTNISYWGDMLNQVISWTSANYGTPATAYNQGLDGRIIREGDNESGPIIPVTVLHHNDAHGRLVPSGSAPGYTNLATLIRQEWQNNPERTILLNAGDTIQGDAMAAFYKAAFTGKGADGTDLPPELWINPIIRSMNAMTYTAMTLGNHEYNFGGHIFTGTLGQANFPLLQANVYDDGRYGLAEVNVRPHITVTVGPENISLAILGIGNHRIPIYELPSNIPGLTFTNPIVETQNRAPALKAANDAVIALTHIGFTEDPKSVEVDANVDTNLAAVTTGVDVIIGSHSHTNPTTGFGDYKFLPTIVGSADNVPVLINQAYRYNTFLGEVVLGMRAKAGGGYEVAARAGKAVPVTTSIPEDPAVKAIITPYNDFLTTYRTRVLGQTITPLDALNAFTEETNAANLQADASKWKLENELPVEIDFHLSGAMTNGKVASAATPTTPYTLTVGDMFTLMPYENSLLVMEINGAQLKQILERGYRNYWYYYYKDDDTPRWGGYSHYTTCMLDVSAGTVITYTDPGESMLPNGNNVAAMSVNGVPVDFTEATTYTVSTVNYLAAGSCNFNNGGVTLWPLDQIVYDTQYYVRDVVIEYIPTLPQPINPQIEGRLVFNSFAQTVGVTVAPAVDAKEGLAGTVVEYVLHITNDGNMADTFLLSYSGVWNVGMPASVIVGAGATADVTVQVTIPAGAAVGDFDVTTITVKSQADPTTQAQAVLTTTVALQVGALELTILHTNDFHARVDEYQTSGARCPTPGAANCIAGSPRIATLVDQFRATNENVLVLDAGDQFQGTLYYNLYKSTVIAAMMNAIGYDAMAVGNHEFDDGPDELARLIDAVNFPVLAANIKINIYNLYLPLTFKDYTYTAPAQAAAPVTVAALPGSSLIGKLHPYAIVQRDGQDIAIVGLSTPETESIASPGPNVEFLDPIATLRATVYDLTSTHHINKIIVLAHQGYDADLLMAAAVSGVDVIIGGHSHTFLYTGATPPLTPAGPYPTVVNSPAGEPVLVVTAYQWGNYLGHLDVTFDPDGVISDYAGNPILVGNSVPKKPEVETLLETYRTGVMDLIATQVGTITVAAPINVGGARICRLGECLMGNLVADAMLWKAKQAEPAGGYQIAVTNGGGLRAPLITGTVTMGDVMEVLPFGNTIATMGLTGADLLAALEHSARLYPSENGGFLQVSGMKYTFDPAQPAGSRITAAEVWNGAAFEPIVPATVYKVVTNNFTRNGGDGYTMFRDNAINPYDFGPDLAAALAEYFQTFSPVTPLIEGRIIRVAR